VLLPVDVFLPELREPEPLEAEVLDELREDDFADDLVEDFADGLADEDLVEEVFRPVALFPADLDELLFAAVLRPVVLLLEPRPVVPLPEDAVPLPDDAEPLPDELVARFEEDLVPVLRVEALRPVLDLPRLEDSRLEVPRPEDSRPEVPRLAPDVRLPDLFPPLLRELFELPLERLPEVFRPVDRVPVDLRSEVLLPELLLPGDLRPAEPRVVDR
jgi:hypothetical protein